MNLPHGFTNRPNDLFEFPVAPLTHYPITNFKKKNCYVHISWTEQYWKQWKLKLYNKNKINAFPTFVVKYTIQTTLLTFLFVFEKATTSFCIYIKNNLVKQTQQLHFSNAGSPGTTNSLLNYKKNSTKSKWDVMSVPFMKINCHISIFHQKRKQQ